MARRTATKQPTKDPKKPIRNLAPFRVKFATLHDLAIDLNLGLKLEKITANEAASYGIATTFHGFDFHDKSCDGYVNFTIREDFGGTHSVEIEATYLLYVESEIDVIEDEWHRIVEHSAESVVWEKFISLFTMINAQANTRLPPPPIRPPGVRFVQVSPGSEAD